MVAPRTLAAETAAGGCPSSAEVAAVLDSLLETKPEPATRPAIVVRDLGDTWEIEVAGRKASYTDAARDCQERIRVGAVFAALVLEPPDRPALPAPAPPADKSPAPTVSFHQAIEVAPVLVVLPGAEGRETGLGWGGSLRWAAVGNHFGLSTGVNFVAPDKLDFGSYQASVGQLAVDVSLRVPWRRGRWQIAGEVGPYGALLFVHGHGLLDAQTSTRLEPGMRAAFLLQIQRGFVSPFLGCQGELGFRRFDLLVDPGGAVGSVPRLWLGLLIGAALGP